MYVTLCGNYLMYCLAVWVQDEKDSGWPPHTMPCDLCVVTCRDREGIPWGALLSPYSQLPFFQTSHSIFCLINSLLVCQPRKNVSVHSENNQVYSYAHMHIVVLQIISFYACEKLKKKAWGKEEAILPPSLQSPQWRVSLLYLDHFVWIELCLEERELMK